MIVKNVIAKICNFIGVLLMLAVIVVMVPLTVPKLFGYQIYAVLTGSMTPAYPVGSVVYVRECGPEDIEVGDVITFHMGSDNGYVMTHRVIAMDMSEDAFITKGDANNVADPEPIAFERLVGEVTLCVPKLADLSDFVNSTTGKSVTFIAFAAAFILWIVADILAPKKRKSGKKPQDTKAMQEMDAEKEKPKETKRSRGDIVRLAVRCVGFVLVIGAGVYLGSVILEYREGESEYKALEELVFVQMGQENSEEMPVSSEDADEGEVSGPSANDKLIMHAISALKEENEEIIGWITFDNMELSYPIMHGADNEYYLNHTFSGEINSAGSIFMEASNHPDFEDCHTIIYGHNMRNLSMFGRLKKYKTEEFYEEHQYFTIYTEEQAYRYQIFAYYDISEAGDVYTIGFEPDETFRKFVNDMIRRSYYDTNVEVTEQDKVITLSTCSTEGHRFVVNAKRIEEK